MGFYEDEILDLFSQLADALEEYECTMRAIAFPEMYSKGHKLNEADSLLIRLNRFALRICSIVKIIEIKFDTEQTIKKVTQLSEIIHRIAENAVALRSEYYKAQRRNILGKEEVQGFNNVLNNLHHLDRVVKEYNNNFGNQIVTLEQARKRVDEDIDKELFG